LVNGGQTVETSRNRVVVCPAAVSQDAAAAAVKKTIAVNPRRPVLEPGFIRIS
jgi:hypothetical protein